MSWIEVIDTLHGHTVLDLQPTVLEVFRGSTPASVRIHLRLLDLQMQGQDGQGHHRVALNVLGGSGGTVVSVDEAGWMRLWPWIEQVRHTQYTVASQGHGGPPGGGLPPGYAPPPGYVAPPRGVVDP